MMSDADLMRMKKSELVDEVNRLRSLNEVLAAVVDKDLTFRDLEMKMRNGTIDVKAVLGKGSQPVSRFLAALMLHFLLGEGPQDPQEPPNYLSGDFTVRPGGGVEEITCAMEIIKPGGKSSHKIRAELEAEVAHLRSRIETMTVEADDVD